MTISTVKKKKRMFLGIINLAILGIIIMVGLWPFIFWPVNNVAMIIKYELEQEGMNDA